jgi:hypothetical protein
MKIILFALLLFVSTLVIASNSDSRVLSTIENPLIVSTTLLLILAIMMPKKVANFDFLIVIYIFIWRFGIGVNLGMISSKNNSIILLSTILNSISLLVLIRAKPKKNN